MTKDSDELKLMNRVRRKIRAMRYSLKTEKSYCYWVTRFIRCHKYKHPLDMIVNEVTDFLTWLAVDQHVAASTQKLLLENWLN